MVALSRYGGLFQSPSWTCPQSWSTYDPSRPFSCPQGSRVLALTLASSHTSERLRWQCQVCPVAGGSRLRVWGLAGPLSGLRLWAVLAPWDLLQFYLCVPVGSRCNLSLSCCAEALSLPAVDLPGLISHLTSAPPPCRPLFPPAPVGVRERTRGTPSRRGTQPYWTSPGGTPSTRGTPCTRDTPSLPSATCCPCCLQLTAVFRPYFQYV